MNAQGVQIVYLLSHKGIILLIYTNDLWGFSSHQRFDFNSLYMAFTYTLAVKPLRYVNTLYGMTLYGMA